MVTRWKNTFRVIASDEDGNYRFEVSGVWDKRGRLYVNGTCSDPRRDGNIMLETARIVAGAARSSKSVEETMELLVSVLYREPKLLNQSTKDERRPEMKFERVRPGEYLAKIDNNMHLAVVRNGRRSWIWWLCGSEDGDWWETDDQGPFPTRKEAMADAIANYEKLIKY